MGATGKAFPELDFKGLVRNSSSRGGAKPVLIVMHATEGSNLQGVADLRNLQSWFDDPVAQASSHIGIDAEGNSARFVNDSQKSWACAGFNSMSLNIEQIGWTSQNGWPDPELHEAARWIAYWSLRFGIPIQKGSVRGASVVKHGVVRHSDLGDAGGNHGDPGKGYDLSSVLILARGYLKRQKEYEKAHNKKVTR